MTGSDQPTSRFTNIADSAGVVGAALAALCCAGTPLIVSALAMLGLSFLKRDAVLWPVMILSLLVALWGFWRGWQLHRRAGPVIVAFLSAIILVSGVIFVHGFPAMQMIWTSIAALVMATVWNVTLRRNRAV